MLPNEFSVIICGGGPCGLMLANELGRRGVTAAVIGSDHAKTTRPQANSTHARTMEHYRRHGFAEELRALGLPPRYPTDIAYFTRFSQYELARFMQPSSADARKRARKMLTGSWSAAERPHCIAQRWVVSTLLRHAQKYPTNWIHFDHELVSFTETGQHVSVEVRNLRDDSRQTLRARYLVATDGAQSLVRKALGIGYTGETETARDFMGGRMLAVHLRAPTFYDMVKHRPAWTYLTFNRDRRAMLVAVDGKGEFYFHTQLHDNEEEAGVTNAVALRMFQVAAGVSIDAEIISRNIWTAGHALVVEQMQRGHVFLAGGAAHLFTPTGGIGYNTGIEDAVNLGWKIGAVIKGQAPESLLATYETERRPSAVRSAEYARQFADALGANHAPDELEEDSVAGALARLKAGEYFNRQVRQEYDAPGVTFGYRYDHSPVIFPDGTVPPPDSPNVYIQSACPGGRAPHFWLGPECSLYDEFGPEWTLLRVGHHVAAADPLIRAAAASRLHLTVLDLPLPELQYLYEADFTLIRPDQIVAWRGNSCENVRAIMTTVTGGTASLHD